ncbi:MAG: hypothetical protein ACE5DN_05245 [Flavobacteriales bacterium]
MEKSIDTERPALLTVLCILSYIGGGVSIVFYSVMWALSDAVAGYVRKKVAGSDVQNVSYWIKKIGDTGMDKIESFTGNLTDFFIISAVLSFISIAGVFLMWKMKLNGFYLYTGAQLFLLSAPYLIFNIGMPSLTVVLFSSLLSFVFIILYALHLKKMHW